MLPVETWCLGFLLKLTSQGSRQSRPSKTLDLKERRMCWGGGGGGAGSAVITFPVALIKNLIRDI